jgi:hypothetical protein
MNTPPAPTKQRQLEEFRRLFRNLTADGSFPPERQQKLYAACTQVGLDWNEARAFVRPEAEALLTRKIDALVAVGQPSADDLAQIESLKRRLGLEALATVVPTPSPAFNLSPVMRRRLASVVTALIMGYILFQVINRLMIVVWVTVPWWGLALMAVALFFAVDYLVSRIIK